MTTANAPTQPVSLYIAYRVQRMTNQHKGSSSWGLYGHISDDISHFLGKFPTRSAAFKLLTGMTGIQPVKRQDYYPVEAPVRSVSATIHFEGVHSDVLPDTQRIHGRLPADADTAEEYLFLAETTQSFFWEAVRNLELHLGFEIDSSLDLQEATIERLKATPGAPV